MRTRTKIALAVVAGAALAAYVANELAKPMFTTLDSYADAADSHDETLMSMPDFNFDTAVEEMGEYACAFCGEHIHVTYGLDIGKRCVLTATWGCGHDIRIVGQLMANPAHQPE